MIEIDFEFDEEAEEKIDNETDDSSSSQKAKMDLLAEKAYLRYFREQKKQEPLSKEEEEDLLRRRNEKEAYNKLVESNMSFVVYIATRYAKSTESNIEELMEYIQSGTIGLMNAIDNYEFNKGARLQSYAYHFIRKSILKAMSNTQYGKVKKIEKAIESLKQKGEAATVENLCREMGIKEEQTAQNYINLLAMWKSDSLNKELDDEEDSDTLGSYVKDASADVEKEIDNKALNEIIHNLSDEERTILHYMMEKPNISAALLAKKMGIGITETAAQEKLDGVRLVLNKHYYDKYGMDGQQNSDFMKNYSDGTRYIVNKTAKTNEVFDYDRYIDYFDTEMPSVFIERLLEKLNSFGYSFDTEKEFFKYVREKDAAFADKTVRRWLKAETGRDVVNPSMNVRLTSRQSFYKLCQILELNFDQISTLAEKVYFFPTFLMHDPLSVSALFYLSMGEGDWYTKAENLVTEMGLEELELSNDGTLNIYMTVSRFKTEEELKAYLLHQNRLFVKNEWKKEARDELKMLFWGDDRHVENVKNIIISELNFVLKDFPDKTLPILKYKSNGDQKVISISDILRAIVFLPNDFDVNMFSGAILPEELIVAFPDGTELGNLLSGKKITGNDAQRRTLRNAFVLASYFLCFYDDPENIRFHDKDGKAAKTKLSEKQVKQQMNRFVSNTNSVLSKYALNLFYPNAPLDYLLLQSCQFMDPIGNVRNFFSESYERQMNK